jgi:hypothetical protein
MVAELSEATAAKVSAYASQMRELFASVTIEPEDLGEEV